LVGALYLNIAREVVVQGPREKLNPMAGVGQKVNYLSLGMGPGVGPAGAADPGNFPGKLGDAGLQLSLNGGPVHLELEPVVSAPIVF
jgi:hypothetical protein